MEIAKNSKNDQNDQEIAKKSENDQNDQSDQTENLATEWLWRPIWSQTTKNGNTVAKSDWTLIHFEATQSARLSFLFGNVLFLTQFLLLE